jgi:hypothetical protein
MVSLTVDGMGLFHLNFFSDVVDQVIMQEMSKKILFADSAYKNVFEV